MEARLLPNSSSMLCSQSPASSAALGKASSLCIPPPWLADVTLYRRKLESAELQRGLEFQQFADTERIARRRPTVEPSVGFGPQGSTGEDNISVISASAPGLVCGPNPFRESHRVSRPHEW